MDLRVQRTINAIENAFIDLTLEKGFKKVSVTEIAKHAQINPKTFYDHFQDKYDLVSWLTNEIISRYNDILQNHLASKTLDINDDIKQLVITLVQNEHLRRAFIALNSFHIETIDFGQQINLVIGQYLERTQFSTDPLVINILAAMVFQVIKYYVKNPSEFSIERQLSVINELRQIINEIHN